MKYNYLQFAGVQATGDAGVTSIHLCQFSDLTH